MNEVEREREKERVSESECVCGGGREFMPTSYFVDIITHIFYNFIKTEVSTCIIFTDLLKLVALANTKTAAIISFCLTY